LSQFAKRVSLHTKIETDDVKAFFSFGGNLVRLAGGYDARELAVFHRRRVACLLDETLFIEIDR